MANNDHRHGFYFGIRFNQVCTLYIPYLLGWQNLVDNKNFTLHMSIIGFYHYLRVALNRVLKIKKFTVMQVKQRENIQNWKRNHIQEKCQHHSFLVLLLDSFRVLGVKNILASTILRNCTALASCHKQKVVLVMHHCTNHCFWPLWSFG